MIVRKLISLCLVLCFVFSLTACASKTGSDATVSADTGMEGKYIAVAGDMLGISLFGEDLEGFVFELSRGGKGQVIVDGEAESIKWESDDTTITVTVEGETLVGTRGKDFFTLENLKDMGINLTFAKEGTDAANPELYLPEADKFMLGTWRSAEVNDILGDPYDEVAADALSLVFSGDHKVSFSFDGKDMGTYDWSLLGDWGSLDNTDDIDLSWDIFEDHIEVDYTVDDEYLVFKCYQGEPPKSAAASSDDQSEQKGSTGISGSLGSDASEPEDTEEENGRGPTEKGSGIYSDFWSGDWYGWWMIDDGSDEYESYDGIWFDAFACIEVNEDEGSFIMWDEDTSKDLYVSSVSVSFHPGTTDAGCMMSESGQFLSEDLNVLHADWISDPGASDVSEYEHMIEIDGYYEDDKGSFRYYIYLRPWGMDWEDVREVDESLLPGYYDSWYVDIMDLPMPESMEIE